MFVYYHKNKAEAKEEVYMKNKLEIYCKYDFNSPSTKILSTKSVIKCICHMKTSRHFSRLVQY